MDRFFLGCFKIKSGKFFILLKEVPFSPLISEESSEEFMINEVINWPFTIVFFVALLGLLVSVMLVTVNQTDIFPNRLLAAYLGCFSLLALNYSLMSTSFFLQFPHTWKILAWASFCFAPFGFIRFVGICNAGNS